MFGLVAKRRLRELSEALQKAEANLKARIRTLEQERDRMRAVVNSMVEGVVAVGRDTRIVSINPTVEHLFGITREESEGKLFLEAIRNNALADIIARVFDSGEYVSQELELVFPVQKTLQVNASALSRKGVVSGCVLVIHDVSEIRKLETMRRDFVANVSHELKTPLTSIKGFVETLLEGALEDKENSRHFLEIIRDHADRLDSLVNDLLTLSYAESRQATLEPKETDLREIVEKVFISCRVQANKKKLELVDLLPPKLLVKADGHKINQVLTNLVDNAVKFNREKGTIKISHEAAGSMVKITVEDSGIGIPAKDIPRIFERFYRVDKARSREMGGTGLGLSIVKHLVELHGGSVGVESTEGFGSTFWFTLPI